MSGGGGGAPFNPSGGPIDNQQRLQTSPNPSLPPADYSMGYARNFQPPSFFNPFSGYYGANTGMGGFQSQFGGFQPQFGGFGGFGGFQQPQYGGFQQPQFGGLGAFQQPQQFQQPFDGGYGGGFQQPFSGGFGGQSNRFTRRGQGYTQPYMPQPNRNLTFSETQPDYRNMNQFNQPQPQPMPQPDMPQPERRFTTDYQYRPEPPSRPPPPPGYHYELGQSEPILTADSLTNAPPPVAQELATRQMPQQGGSLFSSFASTGQPTTPSGFQRSNFYHTGAYGPNFGGGGRGQRLDDGAYGYGDGMGAYGGDGGFNPMMGGLGGFGGFFGY